MPVSESAEKILPEELGEQLVAILISLSAPVRLAEIERVLYLASRLLPDLSKLSPAVLQRLAESLRKQGKVQCCEGKWYIADCDDEEVRKHMANPKYAGLADCIARAIPAIGNRGLPDLDYLKRDIRNAFFSADARLLNASLVSLRDYFPAEYNDGQGFAFLLQKQNWKSLLELPNPLLAVCSWQLLPIVIRELYDIRILETRLLEVSEALPVAAIYPLIDYEILRGNWNIAATLIRQNASNNARMLRQAWLASMFGKDEKAVNLFLDSLYEVRQLEGVHDFYFQTVGGLFFLFSLLRTATNTALTTAENNAELAAKIPTWGPVYETLHLLIHYRRTQELGEKIPLPDNLSPLQDFFWILTQYWMNAELTPAERQRLEKIAEKAGKGGYQWLYRECEEFLLRTAPDGNAISRRFHDDPVGKIPFLLDCVPIQNSWMNRLSKFDPFLNGLPERNVRRLIWLVNVDKTDDRLLTVRPMEQHAIRGGKWSKGRKFTAFRNQNYCRLEQDLDSFMSGYQLSSQDKFACTILREAMTRIEEDPSLQISAWGSVFLALVEHPRILLDGPAPRNLHCVTATPYIRLICRENFFEFQLCPPPRGNELVVLRLEHGDVISVFLFDNEFLQLRQLIGKELRLPCEARQEMQELLNHLSKRYQILSDYPLDSAGLRGEPADCRPEFRLIPENQGMRIELFVKPFGWSNGFYKPGQGPMEMITRQDTGQRRLCRNADLETARADEAIRACPALLKGEILQDWNWLLPNPMDCYEFTLQLHEILPLCVVHWPENNRFSSTRMIGLGNLSLRIQNYKDWFSLDGTVQIDDNRTVSLKELLHRANEDKGRFIVLEDGQVVALSEGFRQRLDDLNRIAEYKNESFRVHHFLQPVLNSLLAGTGSCELSPEWQEYINKMEQAMQVEPETPEELHASLRKYQREGFIWLSRLDALGAGACLADDMGLGKTIQAIAFILSKTSEGPSLIIAPTSVCANWQHEFRKFAPSLRVVTLGNGDRKETLAGLGPGSVLISSYGLLQSENEQFGSINWRVAVLDEAQAIKNYHAKRSQAAMNIKAQFRLVTTGTPVENNLNELWAVFRFINPGLLGPRELFQRRFGIPIEREDNREAMQRLNSLIKPFLLRRRKDQVLKELPPKTNVDFNVELSTPEREFYDSLRQGILADLEKREDSEGRMRIRVLAGITKLRLATCHPRLVSPGCDLPGSKLEAFLELLTEILDGGHKTLVFSQFVKFLSIVRNSLEERGIEYQYLDGSLTTKERSAAVKNFQGGNCPVFLISLKAGGLGLNLTQADYVIHLDSWWNPAVENQASDRAHRLGQNKPVTIYHLLTKNTIEDKIQNLHQWKRDLADQILSGNDKLTSFSINDLIQLLADDSLPG